VESPQSKIAGDGGVVLSSSEAWGRVGVNVGLLLRHEELLVHVLDAL